MTSNSSITTQDKKGYQLPPDPIRKLVDVPPTPSANINPSGEWMLLLSATNMPSIEELAQKELRLAGIRINPQTNGRSRNSFIEEIKIKSLTEGTEKKLKDLPAQAKISNLSWSPQGTKIAFTHTTDTGLELWVADFATATAKQLSKAIINDAMSGLPYRWFSNEQEILFKTIITDREDAPLLSAIPFGPTIQENKSGTAPVRTYQDLLKSKFDEELFKYYTTSQLKKVNIDTGQIQDFSQAAIYAGISISPNGKYVLITRIEEPFSYIVPYDRFPMQVDILDHKGNKVKSFASIPNAENIPKGFGAVRQGPRSITWRADQGATLVWVEAQDKGDPNEEADTRDMMYSLKAPFTETPQVLVQLALRYGGIDWGDDQLAIIHEWWWTKRRIVTSSFAPENPVTTKKVIWDRSWEDAYNDPGDFEEERNEYGRLVLMQRNGKLFLTGRGASPEGNRPFVDEFDLKNLNTRRLWRSEAPYFERPVSTKYIDKGVLFTIRESNTEPPNYFKRDLTKNTIEQITFFENPYKALEKVNKELVQYQREDGVELTGTLYTPVAYDPAKDGRLPVLMWAYPAEYKSASAAGQLKDSPYEFIRIGWYSPIYWVTQGYAVFDDFGMPIVGEGEEEPNETFIKQLVMDAEAAVKVLSDKGIADPQRIAVGGHSYGAFMTANLLAHSDLFAAGIARSGAYNRTLTPYGFQSEERTFWEAPETYFKMSPFMHADKIKAPLLLIHGEADNNAGTYPMQSERFFGALKGQGAPVRLVMLPHESHSYQARESIMHMLWEMTEWLDTHVKKAKK